MDVGAGAYHHYGELVGGHKPEDLRYTPTNFFKVVGNQPVSKPMASTAAAFRALAVLFLSLKSSVAAILLQDMTKIILIIGFEI